ncbi:MAG: hypothetical protein HYT78_02090 [Deltaproteobacteria bacterium]|nr:hypothetical protein [Deltaproteobacteria bacterium]
MAAWDLEGDFTLDELTVSTLATADALAKLLIKKGIITQEEFIVQLFGDRNKYRGMLQKLRAKAN